MYSTESILSYEHFWVEQFHKAKPLTLPFLTFCKINNKNVSKIINIQQHLKSNLSQILKNNNSFETPLFIAILIYLFRITGEISFTLLYRDNNLTELGGEKSRPVGTHIPLNINLQPDKSYAINFQEITQYINDTKEYKTYFLDIFERYPHIKNNLSAFSIAVEITNDFENYHLLQECSYIILINKSDAQYKIIFPMDFIGDDCANAILNNMQEHINELLESIVNNQQQSISRLNLISIKEKKTILEEWNQTEDLTCITDKCLHQLFEEQVVKSPNRIALVYENKNVTYEGLNLYANQLAYLLRDYNVGTETLVALGMERSIEMIIGVLGVLKSGGAYVPLETTYPDERLQFILNDTQVKILLIQEHQIYRFHYYKGTIFILSIETTTNTFIINKLDDNRQKTTMQLYKNNFKENPSQIANSRNLAYIFYTSGSTGNPKGVLGIHLGICNRVLWSQRAYPFKEDDVLLQLASFGFTISIWEIFLPLSVGAKLIIPKQDRLKDFQYYIDLINKESVTFLFFVSSLLKRFLEWNCFEKCSSIRTVTYGGEKLSVDFRHDFFKKTKANLFHAYGTTEVSNAVTHWDCRDNQAGKVIPIGHPISNLKIYILDTHLNPVPVGVVGEIYVSGAGLNRGYLNQPKLTKENFIDNPFEFSTHKNIYHYLYKTGDLGRYWPDGNIECLGRQDGQVKIRGFRVELGEVEIALNAHSLVDKSIVIARTDSILTSQLVAYIIPDEFAPVPRNLNKLQVTKFWNDTLRSYLMKILPEYMVPSAFILLSEIPLNANGKIDKKKLPEPQYSDFRVNEYVAPETEVQKNLVSIWSELFQFDQIGIHDNFFKLGGHSLMAMQMISKIREIYEGELSLSQLFVKPTILELESSIYAMKNTIPINNIPIIKSRFQQDKTNNIPLSFAQQQLWVLNKLLPKSGLYNIPIALHLQGDLSIQALQFALNALIARHEILRTTFEECADIPHQVVHNTMPVILSCHDISHYTKDTREQEIQRLLQDEIHFSFELDKGPLIRSLLLQIDISDHILLINIHHIITDGWSMGIFCNELSFFYNQYLEGSKITLPELPVHYADYAIWQREVLKADLLKMHLDYWQKKLFDAPRLSQFPIYRKCSSDELGYMGSIYNYKISSLLLSKLKLFSGSNNVTLFMTLISVFYVLLYRYSGQTDLVIGTPIANRSLPEIEGLIGFFVNTLALRINCEEGLSFINFLQNVRDDIIEAFAYQDAPFELLVDQLNITRNIRQHPIFQNMFVLQNADFSTFRFQNQEAEYFLIETGLSKFDLTLTVMEENQCLKLSFEYSTDLFTEQAIRQIATHYENLLSASIANPNQAIGRLPLLTTQEYYQLITKYNEEINYPCKKTIHELFEEQVARFPDNVAVIFEDQKLTYKELNEEANQLARIIRQKYIERYDKNFSTDKKIRNTELQADTLIALCLDRSIEMIIAILAVLKAGAAYVPIDPSYPENRIQYILKDTNCPILLTQTDLVAWLQSTISNIDLTIATNKHTKNKSRYNPKIIIVDNKTYSNQSMTNLPSNSQPSNLAYVIFTSGTTGLPKGVLQTHANVTRLFSATFDYFHFNENDVWTLYHSYAFDFSVWEMWGALIFGGTLIVVDSVSTKDMDNFYKLCKKQGVTVLNHTPSVFHEFSSQTKTKGIQNLSLRYIILGGEALNNCHLESWWNCDSNKKVKLFNMYGITETTVHVTLKDLSHEKYYQSNIGKPIKDLKVYILDRNQALAPIGVTGEMYVSGAGLARGYLNQSDLTQQRFVPNLFATEFDKINGFTRLYKTGDLAKRIYDGSIEYIGRNDFQVKINGYRIELGEIEHILSSYDGIKQCMVLAKEKQTEQGVINYLAAYYVGSEVIDKDQLRIYLSEHLPSYMIPSLLIPMDCFPLTINGKLDRNALPSPNFTINKMSYVAPSTELEICMCAIWESILGIEKIGVNDDFFSLGGTSLLVIKLVSKIYNELDIRIKPSIIFKLGTVHMLIRYIKERSLNSMPVYNEEWNF